MKKKRKYQRDSISSYQSKGEVEYIDSTLNANMNKRWVQRLFGENPEFYLEGETAPSTHFMESSDSMAYPLIVEEENGDLKYDREKGRSQGIKFPTDEAAQWFAKNYKKGTNVLKKKQFGGLNSYQLGDINNKNMSGRNKIYTYNPAKGNPKKKQFGGLNPLEWFNNTQSQWKSVMKSPNSDASQSYLNDLSTRNKSTYNIDDYFSSQNYQDNIPDIETGNYANRHDYDDQGEEWDPQAIKSYEDTYLDDKRNSPEFKKQFADAQMGNLMESGVGIKALMDSQAEYDAKPKQKFNIDNTNNQGMKRYENGGELQRKFRSGARGAYQILKEKDLVPRGMGEEDFYENFDDDQIKGLFSMMQKNFPESDAKNNSGEVIAKRPVFAKTIEETEAVTAPYNAWSDRNFTSKYAGAQEGSVVTDAEGNDFIVDRSGSGELPQSVPGSRRATRTVTNRIFGDNPNMMSGGKIKNYQSNGLVSDFKSNINDAYTLLLKRGKIKEGMSQDEFYDTYSPEQIDKALSHIAEKPQGEIIESKNILTQDKNTVVTETPSSGWDQTTFDSYKNAKEGDIIIDANGREILVDRSGRGGVNIDNGSSDSRTERYMRVLEKPRMQMGGAIPTSMRGLFDFPNQPVNVPSNNISMRGINQPVMAYPSNDKPKLMMPGSNYLFPNSRNVVEVPAMMESGGPLNSKEAALDRAMFPEGGIQGLNPEIEQYMNTPPYADNNNRVQDRFRAPSVEREQMVLDQIELMKPKQDIGGSIIEMRDRKIGSLIDKGFKVNVDNGNVVSKSGSIVGNVDNAVSFNKINDMGKDGKMTTPNTGIDLSNTIGDKTTGKGGAAEKKPKYKSKYADAKRFEDNNSVKAMQEQLIRQGFDVGKTGADGKWGKNTQAAYEASQQENNDYQNLPFTKQESKGFPFLNLDGPNRDGSASVKETDQSRLTKGFQETVRQQKSAGRRERAAEAKKFSDYNARLTPERDSNGIADRWNNFQQTQEYKTANWFEKLAMKAERDPLGLGSEAAMATAPIPPVLQGIKGIKFASKIGGKKIYKAAGKFYDSAGKVISKTKLDALGINKTGRNLVPDIGSSLSKRVANVKRAKKAAKTRALNKEKAALDRYQRVRRFEQGGVVGGERDALIKHYMKNL